MVRSPVFGGVALAAALGLFGESFSAEAQDRPSGSAVRTDLYGDPLPKGAIARLGTVRYREGSYFGVSKGLAFLPDGATLVTASEDTPIQFWDAASGRRVREISVDPLTVRGFALSRDGKQIVVAGFWYPDDRSSGPRGQVQVIDVASGETIQTLSRDSRDADHPSLALTPDGKLLISMGNTGVLRIEEIDTGTELLQHKFRPDVSSSIAISPDGQTIAVPAGPNGQQFFLWKWQAGEEPREIKTVGLRSGGGGNMAFSPDGRFVAWASSGDKPVHVWEVDSGQLVARLRLPGSTEYLVNTLAFSPDGKWLLAPTGSERKRQSAIHQWSASTWQHERRLDIAAGRIAISPDSRLIATGQQVFELATGKPLAPVENAHRVYIDALAVIPRGQVATADHEGTIRVWNMASMQQRLRLDHDGWVSSITASLDGTRLASTSFDDTVRLWDLVLGREIFRLPGHGRVGGRRMVAFHPDGDWFFSFGDDMYLRIWDVATGKAIKEYKLRPSGVRIPEDGEERDAFADFFHIDRSGFSPDGQHLVLVMGKKIFFFDVLTGKELRVVEHDDSGRVHEIAFSPDSRHLLTGGWGKALEVKLPDGRMMGTTANESPVSTWDVESGKLLRSFMTAGQVQGIAFSPDGSRFALAKNKPKTVAICSASGEEQFMVELPSRITSMAFGLDGKTLITGMSDTSALIWDLTALQKRP